MVPVTVTTGADHDAYDRLLARDRLLPDTAEGHGRPDPFTWTAEGKTGAGHFAALVLHILSQQISTTLALMLFARLRAAAGGRVEPSSIAPLGADRLRSLGLSHAKSAYVLNLAEMHL